MRGEAGRGPKRALVVVVGGGVVPVLGEIPACGEGVERGVVCGVRVVGSSSGVSLEGRPGCEAEGEGWRCGREQGQESSRGRAS